MADLAIIPEMQQANTQILGEDNRPLEAYFRSQELRFRNKLFEYQKKKDEIDDRVKNLDFSIAGTWERDLPYVTEKFNETGIYAIENPQALNPTAADIPSMMEFNKKKGETVYWATKSKADKAQYDLWKQKIATDADLKNHAADYLKQLDAWRDTPIQDRGDFNLTPQLDYNLQLVQDAISKDLPSSKNIEGKVQYIGGEKKFPTVTRNDMVEAQKRAEGFWANNSHGTQDHFTELYNDPENPAQIDKTVFPSAHDYAISQLLPPEVKAKDFELRSIDTSGSAETNPEFNWIIDNAKALSNQTSPIYSQDAINKSGNVIGKVTHAFDELKIPIRGKDDEGRSRSGIVRGIYNINGKIYASTGSMESKTGYIDKGELIEITNRYNQLITPYINQQYGSSPTTAKAIQSATNYAKQVDTNNELGLPAQTVVGEKKSERTIVKTGTYNGKKVIQYSDGTVEYAE